MSLSRKGLAVLLALFMLGIFAPQVVSASTADELRAQVEALKAQLADLMTQLEDTESESKSGEMEWCHDFEVNMGYGSSGRDVTALQIALRKEGLYSRANTSSYDRWVSSAVVEFQEKYWADILQPWGMSRGSGFTGRTTREKLNEIYGCGAEETKSIEVLSPNGGEEWFIGETYDIRWDSTGVDRVYITLFDYSLHDHCSLTYDSVPNTGKHSFTINEQGSCLRSGDKMKIQVAADVNTTGGVQVKDESDEYLTIKDANCHSGSLWSWEYCTPGCPCKAGEGDCDTDSDCVTGHCAQNVGGDYGQSSNMDVCEEEPIALPDLEVTDLTWGSSSIKAGETTSFVAGIRNNGSKDVTEPFDVSIGGSVFTVDSLAAGEVASARASFGLTKLGSDKLYSTVDTRDVISESNEQNNRYSETVFVYPSRAGEGVLTLSQWESTQLDNGLVIRVIEGTREGWVKFEVYDSGYELLTTSKDLTGGSLWSWENMFIEVKSHTYSSSQANWTVTFDVASSSNQESITVSSPNGGERWERGKEYVIDWEAIAVNDIEVISLVDYSNSSNPIAYDLVYHHSTEALYSWTVPLSTKEGDMYKIEVNASSDEKTVSDESDDYFSIVGDCHANSPWSWEYCTAGCPCDVGEGDCDTDSDCNSGYCAQNVGVQYGRHWSMDVCEAKETKSMKLLSPNGGERWSCGETKEIRWESEGVDVLEISVYEEGGIATGLTGGTAAPEGEYNWHIGPYYCGLFGGKDDLRVKVTNVKDVSIQDASDDYFSINRSEESVRVISPDENDNLFIGDGHEIKWETSITGSDTSCQVDLLRDGDYVRWLRVTPLGSNQTTYDWRVGSLVDDLSGEYQIRVTCADGTSGDSASDTSESFMINDERISVKIKGAVGIYGSDMEKGNRIAPIDCGNNKVDKVLDVELGGYTGNSKASWYCDGGEPVFQIENSRNASFSTKKGDYSLLVDPSSRFECQWYSLYKDDGGYSAEYNDCKISFELKDDGSYFAWFRMNELCSDTDGGKDPYTKGSSTGSNEIMWPDRCREDNGNLVETYCNGEYVNFKEYTCPDGCQDGACVRGSDGAVGEGYRDMENQLASMAKILQKLMEKVKGAR